VDGLDEEDIDGGYRITSEQISRMVESGEVREALRGDSRLQEVIRLIDGSSNREGALEAALESDAALKSFVDHLATVINPGGAPE